MNTLVTTVLCLLIGLVSHSDPFAGKWKVKVVPDEDARKSGEKDFDDTLVFTANKFLSQAGKAHGFGECEYQEDTRRYGPATFTAEARSENSGTMKWSGTVTATEMTGQLVWTKKDGAVQHFAFQGSKMPG